MRAAAAPVVSASQSWSRWLQIEVAIPACARTPCASEASRPVGASTSTRSRAASPDVIATLQHCLGARISGHARHDALEFGERLADLQSLVAEPELADRGLVRPDPLLHNRDRLPDLAARLEEAKQ